MIIGIDGNEANAEKKVGVNQMAFEILWELYKLEDKKKNGHRYLIYLKNPSSKDLPPVASFWKYKVLPGGRVWIITKLTPELLKGGKIDVFFTPGHYLPPIAAMPMVCMITDLGYLKFSAQFKKYDYWQLKWWTAISVIVSKYIIAISETTQKDIVRHYPFAKNKISVAYLAGNRQLFESKIDFKRAPKIRDSYRIQKNYILFLSTLKPSKNIEGLIDAFYLVRKKFDYQLVIAGKKGWLYETIFEKLKYLKLEDDVIFTDYLPEVDKAAIISGAKVLVLPSYWEGFGIDVLNAYSCGVPAIVSDIPILHEVAGQAGVYVDPSKPVEIASGIEKVLKMNLQAYNNLVSKGNIQLKKFSWEKTAAKVLKVLEKAKI